MRLRDAVFFYVNSACGDNVMGRNSYIHIIEKAFKKRISLFQDDSTNCYRLFHSEGDGIGGLSIDVYGA
jgi:23S rRNA G2069 N7-methylase RlmK/C1962 C5-methylase RlmI